MRTDRLPGKGVMCGICIDGITEVGHASVRARQRGSEAAKAAKAAKAAYNRLFDCRQEALAIERALDDVPIDESFDVKAAQR